MATSAFVRAVTRFDVDAELFAATLSVDVVEIVDVMFSVVPDAVVVLTCTCGVNVALAPAASEAIVQVIVPPAPTAGVEHDQAAGGGGERELTPRGSGMETGTLPAPRRRGASSAASRPAA